MSTSSMRSQQGIALIVSLAIISIVGALVLGSMLTTQIEMAVARNDSTSAQAQYVAQAGLQAYKAALFQNFRWLESGGVAGNGSSGTPNTDACLNSLAGGLNFNRTTGGTVAWSNNRIDLTAESVADANGNDIGTYAVSFLRDPNNPSRITIESVGRTSLGSDTRRATAKAMATFIIRNSSTLEQAIFAGEGSGMKFVNGNTTIYGGIYIVGDLANPDTQVIESNGNLSVLNGYSSSESGSPSFLVSEAHTADNLCAAFRVESGKVAIGGSTALGTPDNRLLTVAVGRGAEDIVAKKDEIPECKGNKGVCSETGVKPFDISAPPAFPDLDETPNTEFCMSPTLWRTCIRDEAAADGIILTTNGGTSVAMLSPTGATLPAGCQTALDAAAARSDKTLAFGASGSVDCTVENPPGSGIWHGFKYVGGNPGSFEMYGNVNLRGLNMLFNSAVTYQATSRDETGAVNTFAGLSLESISGVGGDFQVEDDFVSDLSHGQFPNNVISIVAEGIVDLSGRNGDAYTAPIYAGGEMRIAGGSHLFGQVIANVFCTTNSNHDCSTAGNPAEIFFVPTGENRAKSFRAIAPTGGLPTFVVEAYELR